MTEEPSYVVVLHFIIITHFILIIYIILLDSRDFCYPIGNLLKYKCNGLSCSGDDNNFELLYYRRLSFDNFHKFQFSYRTIRSIFIQFLYMEIEIVLNRRGLPVHQTHKSPDNAHDQGMFFTILAMNAIIVIPSCVSVCARACNWCVSIGQLLITKRNSQRQVVQRNRVGRSTDKRQ